MQRDLGIAPVDFVAARIPRDAIAPSLDPGDRPDSDGIRSTPTISDEVLLLSQPRREGRCGYDTCRFMVWCRMPVERFTFPPPRGRTNFHSIFSKILIYMRRAIEVPG